jgi:hypothetical protein
MTDVNKTPPAPRKGTAKPAAARTARALPNATKAAAKAASGPAKVTGAAAPKRAAPELDLTAPADPAPAAKPVAAAMQVIEAAVEAARPMPPAPARPVSAPVAAAVETVRSVMKAAPKADEVVVPAARLMEAGAERAREAYAHAQATGEHFRQAVGETAMVTTRGALEVNGKILDALRAQSDAAFDLWRQALSASSFSEAVRLQTRGARQVYETAATHWKDVAETTTRWLGSTVMPIRSAIDQSRRG